MEGNVTIKTEISDKSFSGASNTVTPEVSVSQGFDLEDFYIDDQGVVDLTGKVVFDSSK